MAILLTDLKYVRKARQRESWLMMAKVAAGIVVVGYLLLTWLGTYSFHSGPPGYYVCARGLNNVCVWQLDEQEN